VRYRVLSIAVENTSNGILLLRGNGILVLGFQGFNSNLKIGHSISL
jgi:hypothetical protein